jgi:hypothetical protein
MSVPKYEKNAGGRPVAFKTVEEMQVKIDKYFDHCDNRIRVIYDNKTDTDKTIFDPAPYTMAGLARALEISRETLVDYSYKDKFSDAIKKARMKVHEDVETRLMEGRAQTGAIFSLKNNFGWQDKKEVELTEKPKFVMTDSTDEIRKV